VIVSKDKKRNIQERPKTIRDHVKILGKKYIPEELKPYVYEIYSFIDHWAMRVLSFGARLKFQKLPVVAELSNKTTIQIMQTTFYDLDGENYFCGGAERYLNDLSQVILEMGYTPFIVQFGNKFWHRKHGNIDVFGVPSKHSLWLLNQFAHMNPFGEPALRIYSPFTLAFPSTSSNAIGISHGIFWDHPHMMLRALRSVTKAFSNLKTLVSVDTSTLSWFRGTIPSKLVNKDIRYIPNYVDLSSFHPVEKQGKKIRIVYPRRLYSQRGYFLVDAIAENILNKYPEVEIHFVGHADESAREAVEDLVANSKGRVLWYQKPDDQMYKVYQEADIVLIPTVASEGTSLSCIEAMATGNAIIATNVGGLSDLIIDGYNGLLISPNSQDLQRAIEKLIESSDYRAQLGAKALEVSKCFDKKIWESRWREILKNACPPRA
jgi:glycosyltransferase involved in cell wall biosynthesis